MPDVKKEPSMPYKVVFHCGAEREVQTAPSVDKKGKGVRADGMVRVVVRSYEPGGESFSLKMPNGERANCPGCKFRRKSGREEYQCFPRDYQEEKAKGPEGKYYAKRFTAFATRVTACYPKEVLELPKKPV